MAVYALGFRLDDPPNEDWIKRAKRVQKHGDHDQKDHGNWATGDASWVGVPAGEWKPGTPDYKLNEARVRQPGGAPVRGTVISLDDPRIPDTVYHVTTNMPAVQESGRLLAGGAGGLGGDNRDRIVSFTTDKTVADQLVQDMRFAARIADIPEPKYITGWGEKWAPYDGKNPNPEMRREYAETVLPILREQARSEGWNYETSGAINHPDSGYGATDYLKQYFIYRQSEVGVRDPVFFSSREELDRIDTSRVGVVAVPRDNLRTGALVTDLDLGSKYGLSEIRVYGDVPIRTGLGKMWHDLLDEV